MHISIFLGVRCRLIIVIGTIFVAFRGFVYCEHPYIKNIDHSPIYRGYDRERLCRVFTHYPWQVRRLRYSLWYEYKKLNKKKQRVKDPTYEGDILFPLRYLIDTKIKYAINHNATENLVTPLNSLSFNVPLRYVALDIEVLSERIPKKEKYPVFIIGFYDSYQNKYYIFYNIKCQPCLTLFDTELIYCENEEELLIEFKELIKELEPDVVLTFGPFDLVYLFNRMERLGISYRDISPIHKARVLNNKKVRIGGMEVLDISESYRTILGEGKNFNLDTVGKKELGYGKIPINGVYEEHKRGNYELLINYNLRDVQLVKELNEQLGLLAFLLFH